MTELQLNKANAFDTEAAFLDLNLSIENVTVSTKTYDKRNSIDISIVDFPFLDGDGVPFMVWLRLNMTEKLLTGTLNKNQNNKL